MHFRMPRAPGLTVAACLAMNAAWADGGIAGYVYPGDGLVVIERSCELRSVLQAAPLYVSDLVRTGSASHARIQIAGFGHLDLDPDTAVQVEAFYRSPNEIPTMSLLELSFQVGSARFVGVPRGEFDTRLGFGNAVLALRNATIVIGRQDMRARATLLDGEMNVTTRSGMARHRVPAILPDLDYRAPRRSCREES